MNDGQKRCEGKSDGKKIRVTVTVAEKKAYINLKKTYICDYKMTIKFGKNIKQMTRFVSKFHSSLNKNFCNIII